MIKKWRESLDQGGAYGALLKYLSKAFHCLPHELTVAKLYAYGVVKLGLDPEIIKNVSPVIENLYDLRNKTKFKSRTVRTVQYGIETSFFVASGIWSSIPRSCKEFNSVNKFKT